MCWSRPQRSQIVSCGDRALAPEATRKSLLGRARNSTLRLMTRMLVWG